MNAIEAVTRWKLAVTIVVLAASVGVAVRSMHRDTRYFMVEELVEQGLENHVGEQLRIHGYVMSGTIAGDDNARTFVLQQDGKRLRVHAIGPVPDRFKDQTEVVVTGELVPRGGTYVLESTELIMRCTDWRERYRERTETQFR